MSNYTAYTGTLPYASELFGVYQPLLGWKSRQMQLWVEGFLIVASKNLFSAMLNDPHQLYVKKPRPDPGYIDPLRDAWRKTRVANYVHNEVLAIRSQQNRAPLRAEWDSILSRERMQRAFSTPPTESPATPDARTLAAPSGVQSRGQVAAADRVLTATAEPATLQIEAVKLEAITASALDWINRNAPDLVSRLFSEPTKAWDVASKFADPLATFDPETQLAVLSPIGVVHLYREYFFELDSFLGPPVGHVWIAPGGSVELFEVNTRRSLTARTSESVVETTTRTELSTLERDELSDAIKEENQRNVKFGSSVSAGSNLFGIVQVHASAEFGLQTTSQKASETTHKHMREQSEKLSSEIRRSFKTTFRTETEETDTSSRRYTIQNPTEKLLNFELRRKMRKVAVQVQHIGTQLCWQAYVDDPGIDLGIAKLVHVASPQDLESSVQPPDAPPELKPKTTPLTIDFPYQANGTHNDMTDFFDHGYSDDARIVWQRKYHADPPTGYDLVQVTGMAVNHPPDDASVSFSPSANGDFEMSLDHVNFHDKHFIRFELTLTWMPGASLQQAAKDAFEKNWKDFKESESRKAKEAYVKSISDRIKAASKIQLRPADELREEERTVIYRKLIRRLMQVGAGQEPHVVAELVRSLFDVDKMLYFVAPEWWMPRERSTQQVTYPASTNGEAIAISDADLVSWGGAAANGRSNYWITGDSEPARMGSSIGWLLQLDGDSHRNAFLNSPWVKAVIPVQPGRELAAMNWLRKVPEGDDNLDAQYVGPVNPAYLDPSWDPQNLTLHQALEALAREIAAQNTGVTNTLNTETVFENGFSPLEGGFRATGAPGELFDQWVEVLPTDQVVAVEYKTAAATA